MRARNAQKTNTPDRVGANKIIGGIGAGLGAPGVIRGGAKRRQDGRDRVLKGVFFAQNGNNDNNKGNNNDKNNKR